MYDIVIIGAGTAGLTAAIYGARSGKKVIVFDNMGYGGQIINAADIENYPGIKSISGMKFATDLYEQVLEFGVEINNEKVENIVIDTDIGNKQELEIKNAMKKEETNDTRTVITENGYYVTKTIIIATGSKNRKLGIKNEDRLRGRGVSYCATCDGAFFKDKTVAVVGGGNTAVNDAVELSQTSKKVYVIHRKDTFNAETSKIDELIKKDNIEVFYNSKIISISGDERLERIIIESKTDNKEIINQETRRSNVNMYENSNKTKKLQVDGLFVAIGRTPDNEMFKDYVNLDSNGYIITDEECKTNAYGIFAAGDCRSKTIRQLTTATADGTIAALGACRLS